MRRYTKHIRIRVTDEERKQAKHNAKMAGFETVSAYIRNIITNILSDLSEQKKRQ